MTTDFVLWPAPHFSHATCAEGCDLKAGDAVGTAPVQHELIEMRR